MMMKQLPQMAVTKYVYCVNNFGHTLFNQMNVSFNGVLMTEQSNAYHHKAYVETMLNYSREEGKTTLAAQGWVNELNVRAALTPTNAGTNDKPNPNDWDGKTGLKALTLRLLGKTYHTFMIKPHVAVFRTGKCLVPGVQIDLELYLNDTNLFLFGMPHKTTSVGKKIPTLEDNDIFVTFWMKKVTLNASVYTRLQKERSLSKTKKVQYPVVRSEIRTYSFDGNSTRWEQDNVFMNKIPGRTIDSEEYPYRSLELTGNTKAEDLVGHDRFLTASGAYKHHKIPMMRPGDWGQGKNCTLFMFNNVPGDADDPEYRNPRLTGNVCYEIDFRAAVAKMEFIALSDTVLNHLARQDPDLNKVFRGVFPADKLPTVPKTRVLSDNYIVNTDPEDQPAEHWLAILTRNRVCEVFDSYGLPLSTYKNPQLQAWFKQWKEVITSDHTLQAMDSQTCGHYALLFLEAKAR
ncbi:unnamed protein product, partial [Porites lobata]